MRGKVHCGFQHLVLKLKLDSTCMHEDEPLQESGIQASVRSAVRMRKAPNPDAEVLHQVKAKNKVEVLLRGEIWTLVKYKGETGYMMSRYLSFP